MISLYYIVSSYAFTDLMNVVYFVTPSWPKVANTTFSNFSIYTGKHDYTYLPVQDMFFMYPNCRDPNFVLHMAFVYGSVVLCSAFLRIPAYQLK